MWKVKLHIKRTEPRGTLAFWGLKREGWTCKEDSEEVRPEMNGKIRRMWCPGNQIKKCFKRMGVASCVWCRWEVKWEMVLVDLGKVIFGGVIGTKSVWGRFKRQWQMKSRARWIQTSFSESLIERGLESGKAAEGNVRSRVMFYRYEIYQQECILVGMIQ